eukprot:gene5086-203_t
MLDEELLDQMFQEDISAVEEDLNIQEVSVYFTCGKCDKGYKTKGGLNRHTRAKHGERSTKEADGSATCELTSTGIFDLVKKTKDELCQNECYPKTMRDTIADCQFQPSEHLLGELKIAFAILKKYADENATLPIDFEVKNNLLENMLKLYLRVRSFSFARDVAGNHLYASRKVKTKALRKDIKKATDKPGINN